MNISTKPGMGCVQKTTLILLQDKPRNPYVAAALTRRAGAHGKTRKAARQQTRQRLQHDLDALLRGELTEFDIG